MTELVLVALIGYGLRAYAGVPTWYAIVIPALYALIQAINGLRGASK